MVVISACPHSQFGSSIRLGMKQLRNLQEIQLLFILSTSAEILNLISSETFLAIFCKVFLKSLEVQCHGSNKVEV